MGEERGFESTALIDAQSMEGLQARSRSSSSMPPPPGSDAQPTSVLDTSKLSELVVESGDQPSLPAPPRETVETVRPGKKPTPVVAVSGRSKYTPTLRSIDFDGRGPRTRLWPLLVGVVVFGAGAGTFLGARTLPPAAAEDTVELFVRVEPTDATVLLDGEVLDGNPHTSTRPRDRRRRTLVVEARGYATQTIDVVFDSSTSVDIALPKAGNSK